MRPKYKKKDFSKENQKKLHDSGRVIIGIRSCEEVFKVRPHSITNVLLKDNWKDSDRLSNLAHLAKTRNIPIHTNNSNKLEQWGSGNQGVVLFSTETPEVNWDILKSKNHGLLVGLDGIEDPHNLGAIVRTSWLLEVDALLCPNDRFVGITPSVSKVASGGLEHVPLHFEANLQTPLNWLKNEGFWIFGLQEEANCNLWEMNFPDKVIFVLGSEDKGLKITSQRLCDDFINIPQTGSGSSYNASVAISLALMEFRRQKNFRFK